MGRADFDNLQKVIRTRNLTTAAGVAVSSELDFDLPRGFIAKIKIVEIMNFVDGVIGASTLLEDYFSALIRDPDDITTVDIPDNNTQHDVIAALRTGLLTVDVVATAVHSEHMHQNQMWDFESANLDVITARNMRFNSQTLGGLDGSHECIIHYSLEEVTDADILNLLDIL